VVGDDRGKSSSEQREAQDGRRDVVGDDRGPFIIGIPQRSARLRTGGGVWSATTAARSS
jgi:hypothetical protein